MFHTKRFQETLEKKEGCLYDEMDSGHWVMTSKKCQDPYNESLDKWLKDTDDFAEKRRSSKREVSKL